MAFRNASAFKHRLGSLVAVIVIHVILVYALIFGVVHKAIELSQAPIETKILEDITKEDEQPPPPPPKLDVPPLDFAPPIEFNIQSLAPHRNAMTMPYKLPVLKANNCLEPKYPPVSEDLGETGTVVLNFLVGVDGNATDAKVGTSSGFYRLDKAALASLSLCKFTPGEVNGQPASLRINRRYTFRMANFRRSGS